MESSETLATFECEKRKGLKITVSGCIKAREFKRKKHVGKGKQELVPFYEFCQDCETGKEVESTMSIPVKEGIPVKSKEEILKDPTSLEDLMKTPKISSENHKVCIDSKCQFGGVPQLESEFSRQFGRESFICKSCMSRKISEGHARNPESGFGSVRRKKQQPPVEKLYTTEVLEVTTKLPPEEEALRLLFRGYESTFEELCKVATAQIRSPKEQMIWTVRWNLQERARNKAASNSEGQHT